MRDITEKLADMSNDIVAADPDCPGPSAEEIAQLLGEAEEEIMLLRNIDSGMDVTDGWQMVPCRGTDDMKSIFDAYHERPFNSGSPYRFAHTWAALLNAAPQPSEKITTWGIMYDGVIQEFAYTQEAAQELAKKYPGSYVQMFAAIGPKGETNAS